jgi:hypothetical protein
MHHQAKHADRLHSDYRGHLCVLYWYYNNQCLFPHTTLNVWLLQPNVFTARYGLNVYVYSTTSLIRMNWHSEPSGYAENPDNWIFLWKQAALALCRSAVTLYSDGFGGLVVSLLASGSRVRGFKPGRSRWIFYECKNPQLAFFGGEVKVSVPCPSFAACKRT